MRGNIGLQSFGCLAKGNGNGERDLFNSEEIAKGEIEALDNYYSIDNGKPVVLLERVSQEIVDAVIAAHPDKVIVLDTLFDGNDQLKTNTALQMRDSGVEFRTV